MNFIDRLFRLEEINGGERCPTYLYRWTLFKWRDYGLYLHHFVGDDWSLDLHDHPKRFVSIGLKGQYDEETLPASGHHFVPRHDAEDRCNWVVRDDGMWGEDHCGSKASSADHQPRVRRFRAPWIRTFPATHIHRLSMVDGRDCWTLVAVLKAVRPWGFWNRGRFIGWRSYVSSTLADIRKACP